MRIAYFAAGTVGAGHLVREEAVRRALQRARFKSEAPVQPEVFHARATGIALDPVHAPRDELDARLPPNPSGANPRFVPARQAARPAGGGAA